MKEAYRQDMRPRVTVANNGKTYEIPVPFTPQDKIELSALYPHAMIMCHYAKQIIAAFPHGTGEQIVIYDNGKDSG